MIDPEGFLNLPKAERMWPVYRIMSLTRLFEMFEQRVNVLVKPFKWDDPFENFVAHLKGKLPTGELVEFAPRYDFYGQCWTITGGTDAMWRIYSGCKRSVRIKVRIARLFEQLYSTAIGPAFIGRVPLPSRGAASRLDQETCPESRQAGHHAFGEDVPGEAARLRARERSASAVLLGAGLARPASPPSVRLPADRGNRDRSAPHPEGAEPR